MTFAASLQDEAPSLQNARNSEAFVDAAVCPARSGWIASATSRQGAGLGLGIVLLVGLLAVDVGAYNPILVKPAVMIPGILLIGALASRRASPRFLPSLLATLTFHAWALGVSLRSTDSMHNPWGLLLQIQLLAVAVAIGLITSRWGLEPTVRAISYSVAVASVVALALHRLVPPGSLPGDPFFPDRLTGLAGHPNFLGSILAIALPLQLAIVLPQRGKWRWLLVMPLFSGFALAATMSRAAWIAGAIGTSVFLFLSRPDRRRALGLGAALLAVLLVASPPIGRRFADTVGDTLSSDRTELWQATLGVIRKSPISGNGWDSLASHLPLAAAEAGHPLAPNRVEESAHSEPLQLAAEVGIIGVGFFVLILWFGVAVPLVAALRKPVDLASLSVSSSLAGFAVASIVTNTARESSVAIFFWAMLGTTFFTVSSPSVPASRAWRGGFRSWAVPTAFATMAVASLCGFGLLLRGEHELRAGLVQWQNRDWPAADRSLRDAASRPAAQPDNHYYAGLFAFESAVAAKRAAGFLDSEREFREVIIRRPDFADAQILMSQSLFALGQLSRSYAHVDRARSVYPTAPKVLLWARDCKQQERVIIKP